jgi:anti-sigma B factor antagonist
MSIQRTALNPDIWLIEIDGRLDQDQAPLLENELTQLIQEAQYHLIVDLTQVHYINSAGLRCLVGTWRKAKEHGGNLWLTGLNDRLNEVFSMVGFDKVFQIYPTVSAAQEALLKKGGAEA